MLRCDLWKSDLVAHIPPQFGWLASNPGPVGTITERTGHRWQEEGAPDDRRLGLKPTPLHHPRDPEEGAPDDRRLGLKPTHPPGTTQRKEHPMTGGWG
jgi:hypothetical protein